MEYPDARIQVFAKAPEVGTVKTRLIPLLGAEGAAALHRQLVEHTLGWITAAALAPVELWCAPSPDHPFFAECRVRSGVELQRQQGGDLGERMAFSLHHALARHRQAVLVGTDCPRMDRDHLARALRALGRADGVVGPAEDGGYVLIGLRRPAPGLFREVPWGSDRVLAVTRRRAAELAIALEELAPLPDLDRPEDLMRIARRDGGLWGLQIAAHGVTHQGPGLLDPLADVGVADLQR
ncbi:TIGR04282 family arsenosugar biosynthesis glycosyltransferase [Endothiovibrio diazotrophicus]